jgi:hypothetical protein
VTGSSPVGGSEGTMNNDFKIKFYHLFPNGSRPEFVQSPVTREWMDNTSLGYSYRCLPMTYANRHGWAVRAPEDISVIWGGDDDAKSMQILSGRHYPAGGVLTDNGTGNGIVTFHINAIPRTSPDWNLWIMPAPNLVVPGASPLSAIIETDWMFTSPTMNWKITKINEVVTFKKGDPVFFFVPVNKTYLEKFEIEHLSIQDDPELQKHYNEHLAWRAETEASGKGVFGKMYMRGQYPDGSTPTCPHNHITKINLNESKSNLEIADE